MFFQTLLSGVLLVLPVAVTVGLYVGIEYQKLFNETNGRFSGNFTPGDGGHGDGGSNGGGGGGGGTGGGHYNPGQIPLQITTDTYCQKFNGITPEPGRYTFNPNQWGDPTNSGDLCMNITTSNKPNMKSLYAANYSVTWTFPQASPDQPVHAFPNAKLELDEIPVQLGKVKSLPIDVSWSYALGSRSTNTTDYNALETAGLNANVAIDMFLSDDKKKATNTTKAHYEIMIWLGKWGQATQPIGNLQGVQGRTRINTTDFELYYGSNYNTKQLVFTWVAAQNTTRFVGDIYPLVSQLSARGPQPEAWLGYIALGSEALFSPLNSNVTFTCKKLKMDIVT